MMWLFRMPSQRPSIRDRITSALYVVVENYWETGLNHMFKAQLPCKPLPSLVRHSSHPGEIFDQLKPPLSCCQGGIHASVWQADKGVAVLRSVWVCVCAARKLKEEVIVPILPTGSFAASVPNAQRKRSWLVGTEKTWTKTSSLSNWYGYL